jgi:hypothetical protein
MPPPTTMPPPSGDGGMMMPPPGAFGNITHMIATVLGAFLQIFH